MRRAPVRAARRWSALLLVLLVAAPVLSGAQTPFGGGAAGLPPGALTSPPQQRGGAAGDGLDAAAGDSRTRRDLPPRDQPRPAGAVADQAPPLPEVRGYSPEPRQVTPAVVQERNLPALDPAAVERVADRTETTRTFDNPDGTRTLRLHGGPANVRLPDGTWAPVDLDLVRDGDRFRPKTGPVDVGFASSAGDRELVRLAFDADHVLSYRLDDAADVPGEAAGAQVTYRGVRPGADLRLTATRTGLKEDLLLASADAPAGYAFTLDLSRLTPRLTEDGAVELVDGDDVVGLVPAGHADDANGVRTTAVRYALDRVDDDTWTLRVDLDPAWLRDPARAFPVTLDPSAGAFNADRDDMYVRSGQSGTAGLKALEVGRVEGQPVARAYLRFNGALNTLRDKYVVGATLRLDNVWSGSCTPRSVTVFEVTEAWRNTWPGAAVGQALATRSFAHGEGCGAPSYVDFPLDADLMTRWTHSAALPHGFSLRAADETANGGRRFASADSPNQPYLDVRYSPEGAAFEVTGLTLPTNTRAGKLSAKVTNLGSSTWRGDGGIDFGFIVKQGDAFIRTQRHFRAHVPPMATHHFTDLPIDPLAPGDYQVYATMFTPEGQDFFVAHGVPYGRFDLKVSNVAPGSDYQQPGSGAVVENRTPTLYAEGRDDDNWPGRELTYRFLICADAELTRDCRESPGWGGRTWAPGHLRWNTTYYWAVKSYDGVDETPRWVGPLALTTRVPQPHITSHLAGAGTGTRAPGLDPNVGNYTTSVTDVSVPTAGPDLTITRTYNSLDPRRDTAFGAGWSSRLDMRLEQDDDGSGNVVITHPTGRQVRYGRNPDGSFAAPSGGTADLVRHSDGTYTLRDTTHSRWRFDALGRLVRITDPAGLTETLAHDAQDRVTTITNDVSGRALTMTWDGPRVVAVGVAGQPRLVWTYAYEGDRMVRACVPGEAPNCTTYDHEPGSRYLSTVLDDGPRAYWRLGETTGQTLANEVARRAGDNEATQHGAVLGVGGALGGTDDRAVAFDGVGSHVELPADLTPRTMSVAVELWFRTTAHGVLLSYADQQFPAAATRSTPLLYVGTDGLLYGGFSLRDTGGPRQVVSAARVADGRWHHALLSGAIDRQTLYLDGQAVGDLAGVIDHRQQGRLTLGAGSGRDWPATNGGDFHFDGEIDEVAVYTRSLGALAARRHFEARGAVDTLTRVTLPQDERRFVELAYDHANDRVRTMIDHEGLTWSLDEPRVQDSTRTAVLRGPSTHGEWTYTFDLDNGGRITGHSHEGAGRSYEYNTAGFLSAVVDELNARTEQTTDARGNRLSRKTCRAPDSCNTEYFTYVTSGDPLDPRRDKLASASDARSSGPEDTRYRTTYDYDDLGRLTRTTWPVPQGHTTAPTETRAYATGAEGVPAGLLVRSTGRRDQVTTYSYEPDGDLVEIAEPGGARTRYTHDEIGRQRTVTTADAGGVAYGTTTVEHTPTGQVARVTEPAVTNPVTGVVHTKVTSYRYDGNGNLVETSVSDATGGDPTRTTRMAYDAHDRLERTEFPDGGVERVRYTDNGLTKIVTDVKGVHWTSQHDEHGLLLARSATGAGVDPDNPTATGLGLEENVYDAAGRLRASSDAMGRTTTYTYYDDGLPAEVVRENVVRGDEPPAPVVLAKHTYDPAGHEIELVTAGGVTTTSTYDAAGFLTATTFDPQGLKRVTSYTRDADGNPTRVERRGAADPDRVETTTAEYDEANRLVRRHDHLDQDTAFTTIHDYDDRGLLRSVVDRRGQETLYGYDPTGLPTTVTGPAFDAWVGGERVPRFRPVTTIGRNTFGEETHRRDAAGGVTTSEYDAMGRVTATTAPDYTPADGGGTIRATTRTTYDHAGLPVEVTDPLDGVTRYEHDPYGRVTAVTAPQVGDTPTVSRTAYTRAGEVRSQTDPTGARTEHTYDELGRRITTTVTDRSTGETLYYRSTTRYDAAGNVVEVTGPTGAVTRAAHNPAGEVVTAIDATDRATRYTYDIVGRPATTTDPAGLVTATAYDLLGRAVRTAQLVDGVEQRASTAAHDPEGAVVAETSAEGRQRTLVRDELGRVVQQVERVDAIRSLTTAFGYDELGNRSRFVDGNGRVTTYTHTPWGLPESTVEPATAAHPAPADRTWTTSYDAAGRAVRVTKPGGVTTVAEYDAQGRLTRQTGAGAEAPTAERSFSYDPAGRITRVGGPTGDSEYRYDDRGNVILTSGVAGTATYRYNGDGTVASRTDASGTAEFGYDRAGRITSVVDALTGRAVDFGYDAAGRTSLVADRAVSGWIRRSLSYDGLGRLTADQVVQSLDSGIPPATLLGATYEYDRDDKVTVKTTVDRTGTVANTYGYDGAGRLTSWTAGGTTTGYGWDDAGNRVSAGDRTYTYDERNRLVSGGGATYAHTARGTVASVTRDGATTASQADAFDRAVADGPSRYAYDALDRVVDRNGSAFRYAGLSSEPVSDGTRVISRLPDGRPFADKAAAGTGKGRMLYADRHGDVVGRYLGGSVDGLRAFDPFGAVTRSSGETSSLGYQGDWTDGDTGAVDMGARWYDPAAARFTTRDDWDLAPFPSAKGNRYQYGDNDPVNRIDPDGHDAISGACDAMSPMKRNPIRLPWIAGLALDMVCNAPSTMGECASTPYRANGSLCPQYRECLHGGPVLRQHGGCYWGDAGKNYYVKDGIPQGNCKYYVGGCSRPGPTPPGGRPPGANPGFPFVLPPVLLPPPPPLWLVYALRVLVRPAPGSTVVPRPPLVDVGPPADQVLDRGDEYTDGTIDVTEEPESPPGPRVPVPTDLPDGGDFCGSLGMTPNVPQYGPREQIRYGGDYVGKPYSDDGMLDYRSTTGRVCLTTTEPEKRKRDPKEVAGMHEDTGAPFDKGHIIAHVLHGGPDRENIVPLYRGPNRNDMRNIEVTVRDQVNKRGESVYYQVTPLYSPNEIRPGEDDPIPIAMRIIAFGDNGFLCAVTIHNYPGGTERGNRPNC